MYIIQNVSKASNLKVNNLSDSPKISRSILDTIGHTPLVRLNSTTQDIKAEIVCKLESTNPANSVKDRIALSIIDEAEA